MADKKLLAILKQGRWKKRLERSPFEGLSPLKGNDRRIVRYLTEEEEAALRQAVRERDQEI